MYTCSLKEVVREKKQRTKKAVWNEAVEKVAVGFIGSGKEFGLCGEESQKQETKCS